MLIQLFKRKGEIRKEQYLLGCCDFKSAHVIKKQKFILNKIVKQITFKTIANLYKMLLKVLSIYFSNLMDYSKQTLFLIQNYFTLRHLLKTPKIHTSLRVVHQMSRVLNSCRSHPLFNVFCCLAIAISTKYNILLINVEQKLLILPPFKQRSGQCFGWAYLCYYRDSQ